jgi:hypothetical protein
LLLLSYVVAFETAAKLGIPALLDAEDMLMEKPDVCDLCVDYLFC